MCGCRFLILALWACLLMPGFVHADEAGIRADLAKLAGAGNFQQVEAVVRDLAGSGDALAARPLAALADGNLYWRQSDKGILIASGTGDPLAVADPVTGTGQGTAGKGELVRIKVNNAIRRAIREASGSLTLASSDKAARLTAAATLIQTPDPSALTALDNAIGKEADATVKTRLETARAAATLFSDRPQADKSAAIGLVASLGTREAATLLGRFEAGADGTLKDEATAGIRAIDARLKMWDLAENVWYGVSLASVLLLAAIGLAITFGVLGVINMAHGEMVMIGAYTTFVVQEAVRAYAPGLIDISLLIALPLAFLVAGAVGVVIERGIIRFLYDRPLETLLATWGVSLILQQGVRVIFGPTNREVSNPGWMSGSFSVGELNITANRLWIFAFSIAVFIALRLILNRTRWGLQMRAVTQNRRMASSMGIRTPKIDALTFGLGSGIAGIAGVALSQIGNVSPNLGQGYIIDSFMVVVFGGVGNLWGTLLGALTLGIANKFLEPYAGAVLGKIIVLVFIILFIQKHPRGLFAPKGRAVEA
ncbi:urea ABC transporter permease subunit UrtB [Labrys sp. KNU-23]|uniref:urea ABC transporter permease subunit UrtB n=1 Tax=Labrys sp. KNU-23 TaxID=2789216 RepID=UPI0011F03091|nr:urea ABC transporter permease subunit UrtB [Labrys sp. KNU-23]